VGCVVRRHGQRRGRLAPRLATQQALEARAEGVPFLFWAQVWAAVRRAGEAYADKSLFWAFQMRERGFGEMRMKMPAALDIESGRGVARFELLTACVVAHVTSSQYFLTYFPCQNGKTETFFIFPNAKQEDDENQNYSKNEAGITSNRTVRV
jgi:hypothetical protein